MLKSLTYLDCLEESVSKVLENSPPMLCRTLGKRLGLSGTEGQQRLPCAVLDLETVEFPALLHS